MANKLTSTLIRVTNRPDDYDYRACINAAPRQRQVNYRLHFDGPGEMKIRTVKLVGSGAAYFTYGGPRAVPRQRPGPLLNFSVTFRPEKARRYRARLKIHYILYRPDGSILSIWDSVLLTGVGELCAVPAPPPGDGVAAPGDGAGDGNGDVPPVGGAPGGGGDDPGEPGGEDGSGPEDGETSDSAGEASGGAAAGSGEGDRELEELTICLRFRKVRGVWDGLDDAKINDMLDKVNRIWARARIRFTRAAGPVELVEGPPVNLEKSRADPHCLDVFIGGSDLVDSIGVAHPKVKLPADVEVHERFREKGAYCSNSGYIELEYGSPPPSPGAGGATPDNAPHQVLAHELGHALGLGPAPDPDADTQEHLDPTTGEPITNQGRLMHPASGGGTGLTDHEVRVARKVQDVVKGGQPRYSGCTKTSRTIFEPADRRGYHVHGAGLRSFPDYLSAYLRSPEAFPLARGIHFGIDLDLAGSGDVDWSADFYLGEAGWIVSAPAVEAGVDAPALMAPGALIAVDGARSEFADPARGFAIDIPKALIGRYDGVIGWRVRGAFGDLGEIVLPARGLATLDITTPQMYLELEQESPVHADAGGSLTLQGKVSYSSTFTGSPELSLRISGSSVVLGSVELEAGAGRWRITADLPALEPACYRAWIDARCDDCGTQVSLPFSLRIDSSGKC